MICGKEIHIGDYYYKEHQFLQYLKRPLLEECLDCFKTNRHEKFAFSNRDSPNGPLDRYI